MITEANFCQSISRWHPHGAMHHLRNLRRFLKALTHAPVAVGFDSGLPESTTSWTYVPSSRDRRVVIRFRAESDVGRFALRWRKLADILHRSAMHDPRIRIHDVLINLEDGVGDGPPHIYSFSRRTGSHSGLIPNPYLLKSQKPLLLARSWDHKSDTVYFRGVSSGSADYDSNARVVLCKSARKVPDTDCRISALVQQDRQFYERLEGDGLIGRNRPVTEMNRHNFLIEADGNASSWDRYKYIGLFGGVPIRFECAFEEYWHEFLIDGVNCVVADRHSLPHVVDRLRSRPREAREIARAAQRLVAKHLLPKTARHQLVRTLCGMEKRGLAAT